MDEASNSLDPQSRKNLYTYIKNHLEKCATLQITHRVDEAEKICDLVGILAKGQFVTEVGSPTQIKEKEGQMHVLQVELLEESDAERINDLILRSMPFLS